MEATEGAEAVLHRENVCVACDGVTGVSGVDGGSAFAGLAVCEVLSEPRAWCCRRPGWLEVGAGAGGERRNVADVL